MVFEGFLAISGLFCDGNPLQQFLSDKLLAQGKSSQFEETKNSENLQ
jgi:hypothetical protein